jgi:hypothetical protein
MGRQWQLGELQGENAASPVLVRVEATSEPLLAPSDRPNSNLRTTPAEAIIEGEPEDWWTIGRRIRIGRELGLLVSGVNPHLMLQQLPPPYDVFNGSGYDGQALFRHRGDLGLADTLFGEAAAPRGHHWQARELTYRTAFSDGGATLAVDQHDGGDVDWWSVDANQPVVPAPPAPMLVDVIPNRFDYPGAPAPRWWQIEDARTDPGGYPPDRGHFAGMLLVHLLSLQGNDWYVFPIDATQGSVVTIERATVVDAFDKEAVVSAPSDWSLFRVKNLARTSLLLTVAVATPLVSDALEDVSLGVDEDANAVWAVEQRAAGQELVTTPPDRTSLVRIDGPLGGNQLSYAYVPTAEVPRHWHPYVIREDQQDVRWLVQGRLVDLSTSPAGLRPEPLTSLLTDPDAGAGDWAHQLDPSVVPSYGLRVERRFILARRTDGSPVLWSQRRRIPLLAPPVNQLRFDVLREQTPP